MCKKPPLQPRPSCFTLPLYTCAILHRMSMHAKVNGYSRKGVQFVDNIVNLTFVCKDTKWHMTTKFVDNYIYMRTKSKLANKWKLNWVATPINFILKYKLNKLITSIIFTLQMAQASTNSKIQSKIIFNVSHFHLSPSMVIVLSIHPLHLIKIVYGLMQWKKLENDVSIKIHQKGRNILYVDMS